MAPNLFTEETIFPLKVYKSMYRDEENIKSIIELLYNLKSKDKGRVISNVGGWQSSEISKLKSPPLQSFYNSLSLLSEEIFKCKVSMWDMWGNISSKHNYNISHAHGYPQTSSDSIYLYSGVLYLEVPPNSGGIIFSDLYTLTTKSEIHYPLKSQVILFPNYLIHSVQQNLSNEDRISLAFNLKLNYT